LPSSIWSGAISFGLVSIPVRLCVATESKDLRFNMLHKHDQARITQRYYCPADGEEVEHQDLIRGYELYPGRMIPLTEEDFAKVPLASLHSIDIEKFVKLEDVDPLLFQKTYFVEPEELGAKPFALLRRALEETSMAAVGKVTIRKKEHLCLIRQFENGLALSLLFIRRR
jgi:DNA end-binding protein Ku